MTPKQLEFFRALCAPFPARALFNKSIRGTVLTYLRAPTIMDRLDDVAGVDGWDVEYTETDRGYICKLGILVPTGEADTRVWLYKSDGGGTEGMTKTEGANRVEDTDNDEKSAYTNAFRRAAYAWGIGRYLWRCGVPAYLGDEPTIPDLPTPAPEPAPARTQAPHAPAAPAAPPAQRSAPPGRPAPQRGAPQGDRNYDNFAVPRSGRALFAWAKGLETHYQTDGIVKLMDEAARGRGYRGKYIDYDEVMVADVAWAAIETIKGWPSYAGEFDHVAMPECLESPR